MRKLLITRSIRVVGEQFLPPTTPCTRQVEFALNKYALCPMVILGVI
jgi:hypothetical protein